MLIRCCYTWMHTMREALRSPISNCSTPSGGEFTSTSNPYTLFARYLFKTDAMMHTGRYEP